ncbi:hypothetical protein BOTBODRAFT_171924 [Botryobasidium botryosum FD-172 SS1]|uniref:Uncharacterized protein n=1 Tax=Botryobasidium botryosum (strain FD-172 SS1) TaxID=930990 RepID=A0A067MRQ4_BOTB1|nr:hypothetical protein BOTBODRAFT_171924 [Botryobasidium botryosum FD-172 SS1]
MEKFQKLYEQFRKERKEEILTPNGLLIVADMSDRLTIGKHTFGTHSSNSIVLDSERLPSALDFMGTLIVDKMWRVTYHAHPGNKHIDAWHEDHHHSTPGNKFRANTVKLKHPDVFVYPAPNIHFKLAFVSKPDHYVLLFWDDQNPRVLALNKERYLPCYPFDKSWILNGHFKPDPGYGTGGVVEFRLPWDATRKIHTLFTTGPIVRPGLVVIGFMDHTTSAPGGTFYGGRVLVAKVAGFEDRRKSKADCTCEGKCNGIRVELDFNVAFNPMCAFTPFWPMVLPYKTNILPFEVKAGEKNPPHLGEPNWE